MIAFTTLFNIQYYPQGVCLIDSILDHITLDKAIFILCMDAQTKILLHQRYGNKVSLIELDEIMDAELRQIQNDRKFNEFCWTLTPIIINHISKKYHDYESIFYLDADTHFLKRADAIFNNFHQSNECTYITEHGYAPEHDQTDLSGRYCVQLIGFKIKKINLCLEYWDAACRRWCFDRIEDNKFGDQKYLEMFEKVDPGNVYVEKAVEQLQAPWNCNFYRPSSAIFYHFHALRICTATSFHLGEYRINPATYRTIYLPYLNKLSQNVKDLAQSGIQLQPQRVIRFSLLFNFLQAIKRVNRNLKAQQTFRSIK